MQLSQILISALLACTVAGTSHNYKEMKDKGITGPTTTPPTQSPVPTPGSKEYKNKAPKVKTMKTKTKAPKAKPTKSKSSKGSKSTSKSGGGKSGGGGKGGSGSGSGSKNGTTGGGGSSGGNSASFPTAVGSVIVLSAPQSVTGSFDGGLKEYDRGQPCNSDADTGSANAVFILESGATLSNVIIGADQLEGVHCKGPCTLKNVWFRDVCEDAISLLGAGDCLIDGGGAQNGVDKIVQHNGLSGTVTIKDYFVKGGGKLYRGCGNCSKNGGPRKVIVSGGKFSGITADLVGINTNYGDTATIDGACGDVKHVCQEFKGVLKSAGVESSKVSTTDGCLGSQGKMASLPAC